MIEFRLDDDSGLPPYHQLVRQIRHAMRLGQLRENDRLPTVKDLAARLRINQNTVLKAYRELDCSGLVTTRPGVGTFVAVTLTDATLDAHGPLSEELTRWLVAARDAGLDDESITALIAATLRATTAGATPVRASTST